MINDATHKEIQTIFELTCNYFRLEQEAVFAKNRKMELVKCRQFFFTFIRQYYNNAISYENIGKCLYFTADHATVLHSIKVVNDCYKKQYRKYFNELLNELRGTYKLRLSDPKYLKIRFAAPPQRNVLFFYPKSKRYEKVH